MRAKSNPGFSLAICASEISPPFFAERGAGEAFQALRRVCSGAQHDRNEIVAFAIDRDRGAAEIGIEQLRDLFRSDAQLTRAVLVDLDDDLDDLVAPIVVIVADAGGGLKQRSHTLAERKQVVGIGPRDFHLDDARFHRPHGEPLDLEARLRMIGVKIIPGTIRGLDRALVVLRVDQEEGRSRDPAQPGSRSDRTWGLRPRHRGSGSRSLD